MTEMPHSFDGTLTLQRSHKGMHSSRMSAALDSRSREAAADLSIGVTHTHIASARVSDGSSDGKCLGENCACAIIPKQNQHVLKLVTDPAAAPAGVLPASCPLMSAPQPGALD